MDSVSSVAGKMSANFSLEALKEPRGFIRVVEFILAIFAFATICSFTSKVTFTVTCNDTSTIPVQKTETYSLQYAYPFDLTSVNTEVKCAGVKNPVSFSYGPKSGAEFFVFIGVMAFLYTMAVFVLYVFFDDLYRKNNMIIIGDFIVTVAWAFLWLVSSAVWAQGVVDLKFYTKPDTTFFPLIPACSDPSLCKAGEASTFATLDVSIIFGFLNCGVWGGNCWFLWKETPWFKKNEDYIPDPGTVQPPTPDSNSPAPLY